MRHLLQKFITPTGLLMAGAVLVLVGVSGLAMGHGQAFSVSSTNDCDDNAVMYCGADSTEAVIKKYDTGDGHNSAKSVRDIYSYFGISSAEIHDLNTTAVVGRVNSNGNVYIQGMTAPVATSATTAGRQNIAGSTAVTANGTTFYTRAPSVSFKTDALPAFVVMKNGVFQFAIIASCANAVSASPTTKPAPPTVTPTSSKPAPTPAPVSPTPSSSAPTPASAVNAVSASTPVPKTVVLPARLVDTGPASTLGVFVVVTVIGAFLHRYYSLRRLR